MKVDDPQLSWSAWLSTVYCVYICCFVNLLAVMVQSLPAGGASGQGVLRETFGPGPLVEGKEKKKGNLSITVLPPRKFSFCLLTVTLYSHSKQSTHAQKKSVFHSFPIHYICFFS